MIIIEDRIHCDHHGRFETFADALAELRRRAVIPWDERPNAAPCTSWKTCGREYQVMEFDDAQEPWKLLRGVAVLKVSAKGVEWVSGFEEAWAAAGGA
jgi:hypothetical protein